MSRTPLKRRATLALAFLVGTSVLLAQLAGDVDGDGDVDSNDIDLILAARNTPAGIGDPRDLDGDGTITVLDARKAVKDCTRAQCAVEASNSGKIFIDKVTDPTGDPTSFSFTLTGGPSSLNQAFSLTDGDAAHNSGPVPPGSYNASEAMPIGWMLTGATCNDGSPVNAIDLGPNETVTCIFTNTQRGTIIVEKQTDPDAAAGSFVFTGDAAGSISDDGTVTVSNLVPGTYTATEVDPTVTPGVFDLTAIACDDGSSATASSGNLGTRTATFGLDPGETVKCTFTNTQQSCFGTGPLPAANLPPPTPVADVPACFAYCGGPCCAGFGPGSAVTFGPGTLCTCDGVECK